MRQKSLQALPWKDFDFQTFKVENSNKPISGVPSDLATAFWADQATKGNKKAIALAVAFMTASLERQADIAFGVSRTSEEETLSALNLFTASSDRKETRIEPPSRITSDE